jgi:hypothetical protein
VRTFGALLVARLALLALLAPLAASAVATPSAPDRDGDGLADRLDRCPGEPGVLPGGCAPRDRDGDGTLDGEDRCPDEPGPKSGRGCRLPDGDGDGVGDPADACPSEPGQARFGGCPAPDRDRDGIVDSQDRCVDRPETWNGARDTDGCPDAGKALLVVGKNRATAVMPASGRQSRRLAMAVQAYLRAVGARSVHLEARASYGVSYGESITRARAAASELASHLDVPAHLAAKGPDGTPRIEIIPR